MYVYIYMHINMHICTHIYIYIYKSICICIYICINRLVYGNIKCMCIPYTLCIGSHGRTRQGSEAGPPGPSLAGGPRRGTLRNICACNMYVYIYIYVYV